MKGYCESEQYASQLINSATHASWEINPKFKSQRCKPASKTQSQNPYPKSNLVKHDIRKYCMQEKKNKTSISVSQASFIGSHSLLSRVFHKIKDPRKKVDSSFGSLTCWLADCAHQSYWFNQLPIPYPRRKTRASMHTGIIRKNTKKADSPSGSGGAMISLFSYVVFLSIELSLISELSVLSFRLQLVGTLLRKLVLYDDVVLLSSAKKESASFCTFVKTQM